MPPVDARRLNLLVIPAPTQNTPSLDSNSDLICFREKVSYMQLFW
jgi:hypothetical protein